MKRQSISSLLWGNNAKSRFLYLASFVLIFAWLGGREIWTQEHRWADIVAGMFIRQDFFHPYLGEQTYYDKPLLSYWMMAGFAKLFGSISTWALRLPSALSGMLAIWSIVRLGTELKNRQLGLLAGWMLLTTFYFLFWARTSSADMLNLAGSLFAVTWYMMKRDTARFVDFVIFFLIVALTSLCKGFVGAVVTVIAVLVDIVLRKSWRQYLTVPVVLSIIPGLLVYLAPFIISSMTNTTGAYAENGLYLVYRENVLRYFQPFDHQGPIYTYFIYLPIYLMPWAFFFIPALFTLRKRWSNMTLNSRWIVWTVTVLFAFFTISGSRRSYYVLPIVPFALLMTADWLVSSATTLARYSKWVTGIGVVMFMLLLVGVDYLPAIYNAYYGASRFAHEVEKAKGDVVLTEQNVLMLDGESKLNYYLDLPPTMKNNALHVERNDITPAELSTWWPLLKQYDLNKTIIITRRGYLPYLEPYVKDHRVVSAPDVHLPFISFERENDSVALIPIYMR